MEWESDSLCHSHTYPRWHSGWGLEFRDCGAIPGWGLLLTVERWIEGMWGRRLWWEMPVEESQAAMEARRYCWVMPRGWSHHQASLFPHASIDSWTRERLAHQTPDALIYRVGPHPGGPLYGPHAVNNREGPQAREPSKHLNGWHYGERLDREAFWSPATRGLKKDWYGHNSCDRGNLCPCTLGITWVCVS